MINGQKVEHILKDIFKAKKPKKIGCINFCDKNKNALNFWIKFQKKRLVFLEKRSSSFFSSFIGRKKLRILIEDLKII